MRSFKSGSFFAVYLLGNVTDILLLDLGMTYTSKVIIFKANFKHFVL